MILIGLTGSIGTGKSTTTAMFADAGAAVYDADTSVHRLYAEGGAAVGPVGHAFPGVVSDGAVDRALLSARVTGDAAALKVLEGLVHPLLGRHRAEFLAGAQADGKRVAVLDIPLLFETRGEGSVDAVVVVSAPADVQRARVLARPGMDEAKFAALLARQLADADKRARADFVIDTGSGLDAARRQVDAVLATVLDPAWRSGLGQPRRPRPSAALDGDGEAPQGLGHGA